MRKSIIDIAGAAGIAIAVLTAPAVLLAHENGTSQGGMMMRDGAGMMERMSRMMDRCETMMEKMGGDEGPQERKSDSVRPAVPGTSG